MCRKGNRVCAALFTIPDAEFVIKLCTLVKVKGKGSMENEGKRGLFSGNGEQNFLKMYTVIIQSL